MDDMDEDFVVDPQEEEDDEEEEEDSEEEGEEESDDDEEEDQEGVLDAGVVGKPEKGQPRKNAAEADITLYLECTQPFPSFKHHPILKFGVTVQIGLSKSCTLASVFERYVDFCNENDTSGGRSVELSDLEFVHSHVLNGSDTAEAAALMKNDRISVRREQSAERRNQEVFHRLQRESDKEYVAQLRRLLPTPVTNLSGLTSYRSSTYKYADAVLECRGTLPDVGGFRLFDSDDDEEQSSASTLVRCHTFMVAKRCPWLERSIAAARQEQARRSVVTLPDHNINEDSTNSSSSQQDEAFDMLQRKMRPGEGKNDPEANEIENDDDEQQEGDAQNKRDSGMDDDTSINTARDSNVLYVTVENHPPEAVKLLLEYCYTNRVVPLGYHAFVESCKTKPHYKKQTGPVAPISNRPVRWPNLGEPCISFSVALAGIQLAEEASMPRLSLMCEVAASRLVEESCSVDALLACETQRNLSGNELPRLRKAAMETVLRSKNQGPSAILGDTLAEKGHLLVPTLLTGASEAVEAHEKKKKASQRVRFGEERDWKSVAYSSFKRFDRMDAMDRQLERRKRRAGNDSERSISRDLYDADEDDENIVRHISLKRMSHHLGGRLQLVSKVPRRSGKARKRTSH